jgi:FG-GAP repeat
MNMHRNLSASIFAIGVVLSSFCDVRAMTVGPAPINASSFGTQGRPVTHYETAADLTAQGVSNAVQFGFSVAISGDTAVVSAPMQSEGLTKLGVTHVFARDAGTGIWSPQAHFNIPQNGIDDMWFVGCAPVAIDGDTIAIGSSGSATSNDRVLVYVRSEGVWALQQQLTLEDGTKFDNFGCSVAISGDTLVVGAPGRDDYRGAAYVFTRSGSMWTQRAELQAADGQTASVFGFSSAISGSTIVVGAPFQNNERGAAYVFGLSAKHGLSARNSKPPTARTTTISASP